MSAAESMKVNVTLATVPLVLFHKVCVENSPNVTSIQQLSVNGCLCIPTRYIAWRWPCQRKIEITTSTILTGIHYVLNSFQRITVTSAKDISLQRFITVLKMLLSKKECVNALMKYSGFAKNVTSAWIFASFQFSRIGVDPNLQSDTNNYFSTGIVSYADVNAYIHITFKIELWNHQQNTCSNNKTVRSFI